MMTMMMMMTCAEDRYGHELSVRRESSSYTHTCAEDTGMN